VAEVVQRFVGHAAGQRAVAHDGDHVALAAVAYELLSLFERH
jgi:hypothetical protein